MVPFSDCENVEESAEFGTSDSNQCFAEAKRLKHLADTVSDPIEQCPLYMDAVLYFLFRGDAMEKERRTEVAVFTMFQDTLFIIKIGRRKRCPQEGGICSS